MVTQSKKLGLDAKLRFLTIYSGRFCTRYQDWHNFRILFSTITSRRFRSVFFSLPTYAWCNAACCCCTYYITSWYIRAASYRCTAAGSVIPYYYTWCVSSFECSNRIKRAQSGQQASTTLETLNWRKKVWQKTPTGAHTSSHTSWNTCVWCVVCVCATNCCTWHAHIIYFEVCIICQEYKVRITCT